MTVLSLQLPSDWFVRVCDNPHELQMFNISHQNDANTDVDNVM